MHSTHSSGRGAEGAEKMFISIVLHNSDFTNLPFLSLIFQ